MSCFAFLYLLLRRALDLAPAPVLPLVSCQEISIRSPFSANFWLALAGFLVVQFIHARSQECGLGMAVRFKFQMVFTLRMYNVPWIFSRYI